MKTFTKYFCFAIICIAIGYAWAYHHYMPTIRAYKACLTTYQEYFINYSANEPWAGRVPHKTSKKYETKP